MSIAANEQFIPLSIRSPCTVTVYSVFLPNPLLRLEITSLIPLDTTSDAFSPASDKDFPAYLTDVEAAVSKLSCRSYSFYA